MIRAWEVIQYWKVSHYLYHKSMADNVIVSDKLSNK